MKKVALMQPYLFPYIGYIQLIKVVDTFIIYDDVQWIKGGWINRNRILTDGVPEYLTIPVQKDSMTKHINQRYFVDTFEEQKELILENLEANYNDAPYYKEATEVIKNCFEYKEKNVAKFVANSLKVICEYLNISTEIIFSTSIDGKDEELRSQARVIDIVTKLNATQYINAIGGTDLYDKGDFKDVGIQLSFIKTNIVPYKQFDNEFVPYLSIIDIMMFNSRDEINTMLDNYELI